MDKAAVTAFDREKRVYKDAYVDHFRKVRHFPALAALGSGQVHAATIVLVQEPLAGDDGVIITTDGARPRGRKLDGVASRLIPADPLADIFESTPPLASFRSAILCKHSKARAERASASSPANNGGSSSPPPRYGVSTQTAFKPTSAVSAKATIERKVTYDGQAFKDPTYRTRSYSPRAGVPQWAHINPTAAREDVRGREYMHLPPEGAIQADRRYTDEFVRLSMDAQYAGRRNVHEDARR